MQQVSQAERWVNEYCNRPNDAFTGTIPDGVTLATLHMAKYYMDMQMVQNGHLDEMPITLANVIAICEIPLAKHKKPFDYSSSASDFHLPTLRD